MQTHSRDQAAEYAAMLAQYIGEYHPDLTGQAKLQAIEELRTRTLISGIKHEEACKRLCQKLGVTRSRHPSQFGDIARACRDEDAGRLSQAERKFVREMCLHGFAFTPSHRQRAWLERIYVRLSARAAA